MTKTGRNAACPCGSGLKYKRCCGEKDVLDSQEGLRATETYLLESVYDCILMGVWTSFHAEGEPLPDIPVMENFYHEIYGYDLDPSLVEEIVLPLSGQARARLLSVMPIEPDDQVIDVDPMPPTNPA